jgi:GNAT superfamily N-acetyltransferase
MATTTLTIIPLDAADPAAVDGAYRVQAAAVANDVPDFPEPSRYQFEGELRVPWPGHDGHHWIARRDDGEIVGYLSVGLPTLDNLENAFIDPVVAPPFRRQGIGRALFERGVAHARAHGRRRVMAHTSHALPGGVPRDPASRLFAERMGMRPALEEIRRHARSGSGRRSGGSSAIPRIVRRAAQIARSRADQELDVQPLLLAAIADADGGAKRTLTALAGPRSEIHDRPQT